MDNLSKSILALLALLTLFTVLFVAAFILSEPKKAQAITMPSAGSKPMILNIQAERFGPPKPEYPNFDPYDFEIYTMNSAYSEATLTFRSEDKEQVMKMPEVNGLYMELIDYGKGTGRVVFRNVRPEKGFYLKVVGKNGTVIATWSQQPLRMKVPFRSGYLHVCYGPHLYLEAYDDKIGSSEFGLWPVGHESNEAVYDAYPSSTLSPTFCPLHSHS